MPLAFAKQARALVYIFLPSDQYNDKPKYLAGCVVYFEMLGNKIQMSLHRLLI